jgi:hypothetical protein
MTLVSRAGVPFGGFSEIPRNAAAALGEKSKMVLCVGQALIGRQLVPVDCAHQVLRNPEAFFVLRSEVGFRLGIAACGGEREKELRLPVILPHAYSLFEHQPDLKLGVSLALICGKT